jgi:hypothetical protein
MKADFDLKIFQDIEQNDAWRFKFLTFVVWMKKHNSFPNKKDSPLLYFWMQSQKIHLKRKVYQDNKLKLLKQIGLTPPDPLRVINVNNKIWYGMFREYHLWSSSKTTFPHLKETNPKLYHWIRNTKRYFYGQKGINDVKRNLMERVGWSMDDYDPYNFDRWFNELLDYKGRYGTTHVPQNLNSKYYKLSRWVNAMRMSYARETLDKKHIARLNWIGFIWDMEVHKFQIRVNKLKQYHAIHGTFDVRGNDDRKLANWVACIRCRPLTEKKFIVLLNDIDFTWKWTRKTEKQMNY